MTAVDISLTIGSEHGCRCWASTYALGHDGHCCFVREDRNRRIGNGFKDVEDICHVPAPELDDDDDQCESPDTYLDRVDGHWYVVRYDRTLPQRHAADCETCVESAQ